MDRIIEVKVCGNHLTKDSNKAGTKGEGNITKLRITFDDNWGDFAKQVVFWDAYGQNPVRILLTTHHIEDITKDTRVYIVPIPHEAMARAGWLTFSVRGSLGIKTQVSISSTLEVEDSPDILESFDPTPSEVEQMQAEIEAFKDDIQDFETAHRESVESAKIAKESADKALATVGMASYIGENGYWFAWDWDKGEFYDTGVKAHAGSMVYVGSNPPEYADVWINQDEEGVLYIKAKDGQFVPIDTIKGKDGKSAYDQAVDSGYNGTLEQFTTLLNNLTYSIDADHMSDINNPHNVTAKQTGAIPEVYYLSNDLNVELQQGGGKMTICCYASGTLNTPMSEGLTDYAHGMVITNSYTEQYGSQLCLPSGDHNMYLRRCNKQGITAWMKVSPEDIKKLQEDLGTVVSKSGDTMTGALTIDKDTAWGQIVLLSPSGYYRSLETNDKVIRLDVRDEQLTTKRRYIELCTNTTEDDIAKSLRLVQERDGASSASYVLHTNNINSFVVSSGSYVGTGAQYLEKTIPIRKTTQMVIILGTKEKKAYARSMFLRLNNVAGCDIHDVSASSNPPLVTSWADESLKITAYNNSNSNCFLNEVSVEYHYVLIG